MTYNILNLTPISHIAGLEKKLASIGAVTTDLSPVLNRNLEEFDVIFTNPNKMTYKIDMDIIQRFATGPEHEVKISWTDDMFPDKEKFIVTASTGTNHIDVEYAEFIGLKVLSLTKEIEILNQISSTAEHALTLTLALARSLPEAFSCAYADNWSDHDLLGMQLKGKTVGVLGYGRLGKMYAKYMAALDCRVLVHDPFVFCPTIYQQVDFDTLLKESDIISIHVHLTDETKHILDYRQFKKMEQCPLIVNTSRGDIVDELAVIEALDNKLIRGYAADVVSDELSLIVSNSPIIKASIDHNIIITPHIGGATKEAQEIAYHAVVDMLINEIAQYEQKYKGR